MSNQVEGRKEGRKEGARQGMDRWDEKRMEGKRDCEKLRKKTD